MLQRGRLTGRQTQLFNDKLHLQTQSTIFPKRERKFAALNLLIIDLKMKLRRSLRHGLTIEQRSITLRSESKTNL